MEEAYGGEGQQRHGRLDEVKAKAGQAGEAAKRKLADEADARKGAVVSRLEKLAEGLDRLGRDSEGPEGQVFTRLSGYVRNVEGQLQNKRADELASMAARELKERPALLAAGAFAIGFLGARLLK